MYTGGAAIFPPPHPVKHPQGVYSVEPLCVQVPANLGQCSPDCPCLGHWIALLIQLCAIHPRYQWLDRLHHQMGYQMRRYLWALCR